ncbi:LPP20 family lipoprotein [Orenia marismortui]|uniref:LPP20 family lipoprotein n=1 Tax=Orenia marismortui TaxID=46469 RepID=UPI00035E6288|nr:hypothetical protein [Orenia marismortui]
MLRNITIYLLCLIFLFSVVVHADVSSGGIFEKEEDGYLDWEKSVVRATGFGIAPSYVKNKSQAIIMAREAAITMAQRRLLEIIKGVRIDSEQTVENAQIKSDLIKKKVSGLVKGAQIVEEKKMDNRSYMIVVELQFYGRDGIIKAIFPTLKNNLSSANNSDQIISEPQDDVDENYNDIELEEDYTGVIITTSSDLSPALSPKIYNEDGRVVYSIDQVKTDEVITNGIVSYSRSLIDAKNNSLIGDNPLIINAQGVRGEYKTDLILSNEDSLLLEKVGRSGIFSQSKVVIVLN